MRSGLLVALASAWALGLTAPQARALTIDATIDPSVTDPLMIADIQLVTSYYQQFSNPETVSIGFRMGTDPGYVGESRASLYYATYGDYTASLIQDSADHPWNTDLATAVAHLGDGNRPATTGRPYILGTSAAFNALGAGAPGYVGADWVYGDGTFDGVVGLSTAYEWNTGLTAVAGQYSAITTLFHEVDEILGIGGGGSNVGWGYPDMMGTMDLYRYDWFTGLPSYTTDPNAIAYFSIDGGKTRLEIFDNFGVGDYGDWARSAYWGCAKYIHIQDTFCGLGQPAQFLTPGSPEVIALHAIGYNPVPEPRTWTMLIVGLGMAGFALRRRRGVARAV
jgi:hypothetical protein